MIGELAMQMRRKDFPGLMQLLPTLLEAVQSAIAARLFILSGLTARAGEDLGAALTWAKVQPPESGAITHLCYLWLQHRGLEASRYILQHSDLD